MRLTDEQKSYIREHRNDDVARLLLSAGRYPALDVPFLAEQIAARRQIREKLPSWYANEELVFPAKIAAEQCSSELTAYYKQRLVSAEESLCDLTGGLGIDSYFLAKKARKLDYFERNAAYCQAARYNFSVLGMPNITVHHADITEILLDLPEADSFYIDPARRGEGNKRVYALADCEPDLPALLPVLLQKARRVIAKLSPMADIQQTVSLLPGAYAVHILSVRNECKELLVEIGCAEKEVEISLHCVDFLADGTEQHFDFTLEEERAAQLTFADQPLNYLYEPNAAIRKAGAFRCISSRLGVDKLHINSHLYTSDALVSSFPGRIFRVERSLPFSSHLCKTLVKEVPQANITCRNFPLTADELRRRTKLRDGGDCFLFATTLRDNSKQLIICRKEISRGKVKKLPNKTL